VANLASGHRRGGFSLRLIVLLVLTSGRLMVPSNNHLRPRSEQFIADDPHAAPRLIVTVDVEEQFDWERPICTTNTNVTAVKRVSRAHRIFEAFKVTPTYVVDYPVATQPDGYRPLLELMGNGACLIGAQLHPWVSPPFDEPLTIHNSYAGNLPRDLESAKLRVLTDKIQETLGVRPVIYKAGRYGIGNNTAGILAELGYRIDLSVYPHKDFRGDSGPDFRHLDVRPFWFGERRELLCIPLTCGFTGSLWWHGSRLYPAVCGPLGATLHVPGILARLNLLNRVTLTPEGMRIDEAIDLTRSLLRRGIRIFSLAFHSPSLEPGNTPYVRDARDLTLLLNWLSTYFEFFFGEIGGRPDTPISVLSDMETAAARGRPPI